MPFQNRTAAMITASIALACASCSNAQPPAEPITAQCTVTDGDTIRCGDERVRLLGIDAPEMGGRCRPGRTCVEGDPDASKRALAVTIRTGALSIVRAGNDRYGRTLAVVYAGSKNLSCAQIESGQAEYIRRWDKRRLVARDCPSSI